MDDLTPAEIAEAAFVSLARKDNPTDGMNSDRAMRAWENAFSAEVWNEYANDQQRWDVALSTLKMIIDQA
jgi:hypothetical protein